MLLSLLKSHRRLDRKKKLSAGSALRERVKELACLYGISELAYQNNLSLPKLLQKIVKLIPPAWQYPEYAAARITLDKDHYDSVPVRNFPYRQAENIVLRGKIRGYIEVFYTNRLRVTGKTPFLKEEKKLIRAIAEKLALVIERKEAKENMQSLEQQVQHADRLASIGELTAGIAHELNNPLNSILGFAQLAMKNQAVPEEARQDIEKIVKASLHSREIIKKLMYFAHQVPQSPSELNLNDVIRDVVYFIEPQCKKENINIHYDLEKSLPLILADPLQLNQVIVNLIVNAIQAMPDGGKLILSTSSKNNSVFMGVEDTGSGIPAAIIDNIFDPFFTTKEPGKGTGLGLSVVHGILTGLGGKIKVKSKEGIGTKFEVELHAITQ